MAVPEQNVVKMVSTPNVLLSTSPSPSISIFPSFLTREIPD
jgi:hypothetical protein